MFENTLIYKESATELLGIIFKRNLENNPIGKSMREYIFSNYISLPTNAIETVFMISPLNLVLVWYVERTAKLISKHLEYDLSVSEYIQLTRFIDKQGFDRINCDWCSIVNGFNEFYTEAMKYNKASDILSTKNIFLFMASTTGAISSINPLSCFHGTKYCTKEEALQFVEENEISCRNEFEKIAVINHIKRVLSFKNLVAEVEKRWCPFGYMQDLKYERNYYGTDLEKTCEELRKLGKVSCEHCITILNENKNPSEKSVYENFLKRLTSTLE